VKQKKVTGTSITLSWKAVKGAKSYIVYGARCGVENKAKELKTVKKTSFTQKKLKAGTYYKYYVVALDKNGRKIAISRFVHIVTKGGQYSNPTGVLVNKTTVKLKKGKTFKLEASEIVAGKMRKHRTIQFESSNKKIATVTGTGKIKAKKKGTCYIYVYAENGVFTKVKVRVS
jgi:fibronectin type 3 domain-containing protein